MTRQEHLLVISAEECTEVAHRLIKALRFGLEQVQATAGHSVTGDVEESLTNRDRIYREFWQLRATLGMAGIDAWSDSVDSKAVEREKVEKVERFLKYSEKVGTLV